MTIQAGIKTPGVYTDVNINTQRTGLPDNTQKILFITPDTPVTALTSPVDLYTQADADAKFGTDSSAGRMIKAAVKTNRFVNVQGYGIEGSTVAGRALTTEESDPISTESGSGVSP